jgi:hypothetical protein
MGDQKGPLVVEGKITSQNYVLRPHPILPFNEHRSEATSDYVFFQQDGAPTPRAKNTNKYLQDAGAFPYPFP